MRRNLFLVAPALLLVAVSILTNGPAGGANPAAITAAPDSGRGKVVIANRAGGTVSVIDVHTDQVVGTHPLPAGPNPPEPMYVVHSPARGRVFVGDRANSRVVVFDSRDFSVEGTVPAGAGVFHMWGDKSERQLWVNSDVAKTITVIDTITLDVISTIPTPADLNAAGGRPHDVILDPTDTSAYITMIGVAGPSDYVVKYSAETFEETGRAAVGKDPHVSLSRQGERLYVPCQAGNVLIVLNRETLEQEEAIPLPGAHGAGMARNGKRFYTTNLPGGGADGLFVVDTDANAVLGSTNTPFPAPHNIALTPDGKKLYLTHSGATANRVTIYDVSGTVPTLIGEVTVGLNPFGLAYVP